MNEYEQETRVKTLVLPESLQLLLLVVDPHDELITIFGLNSTVEFDYPPK